VISRTHGRANPEPQFPITLRRPHQKRDIERPRSSTNQQKCAGALRSTESYIFAEPLRISLTNHLYLCCTPICNCNIDWLNITLYLKFAMRFNYCWRLPHQYIASLDTNFNLLWRKYMLTTQMGRLLRKFLILSALAVCIAAFPRNDEAALQLPCCQACLNTYRNCLTGCGSDSPCKHRCYDTYYKCISSCNVESISSNAKSISLICPL
jgi:hypothetical protein